MFDTVVYFPAYLCKRWFGFISASEPKPTLPTKLLSFDMGAMAGEQICYTAHDVLWFLAPAILMRCTGVILSRYSQCDTFSTWRKIGNNSPLKRKTLRRFVCSSTS